jgi:predicted O-methyltransferase YrrM
VQIGVGCRSDLLQPSEEVPILTSLTGLEVGRLCHLARDRHVLEVGSAFGFSAIAMARVGARVVAVDPHEGHGSLPNSLKAMQQNLWSHGVANRVMVMLADSRHALPALLGARARFGLVFIDGDHRRESVSRDMRLGWGLLESGGHLAVHDYGEDSCPDVRPVCDEFGGDAEVTDTLWVARKP